MRSVLAVLTGKAALVAMTNAPGSQLAQAAQVVLLLHAGAERLVAGKSYTNTLGALWLASRHWAGVRQRHDLDSLSRVADRMAAILADRTDITDRLLSEFGDAGQLIFLGHGPHAATARQAAMVMSEWSKLPALNFGISAFRHGFIETVTLGTAAVVFAPTGSSHASAEQLAGELASYRARVLIIENGGLRRPGEPRAWIINNTDPTGLVAEAILKHTSSQMVGLCSDGLFPRNWVCRALGVTLASIYYDYFGLNHLSFAYNVKVDGRPLTDEVTDEEFRPGRRGHHPGCG